MEQVKADELGDRNLWRTGLAAPLPVWKRKGKKHPAEAGQQVNFGLWEEEKSGRFSGN